MLFPKHEYMKTDIKAVTIFLELFRIHCHVDFTL